MQSKSPAPAGKSLPKGINIITRGIIPLPLGIVPLLKGSIQLPSRIVFLPREIILLTTGTTIVTLGIFSFLTGIKIKTLYTNTSSGYSSRIFTSSGSGIFGFGIALTTISAISKTLIPLWRANVFLHMGQAVASTSGRYCR